MKPPSNDANRPNPTAPGKGGEKGGDKASGTGAEAAKPGIAGQQPRPDVRPEPGKPDQKDAPKAEGKPSGPSTPQAGRPAGPAPTGGTTPAAAKAAAEPPKPATAPVEPARPGMPAGSPSGAGAARSEPTKEANPGAGSSASTASGTIKPEPAGKPGEAKPVDPKSADTKSGDAKEAGAHPADARPGAAKAEPFRAGGNVMDGPILDLKAKRVPDPAEAAKGGPAPAGARTEPGRDASKDGPKPASAASPIPKAAPAAEAARGGAGFGSVAAAGLLGGVIGAGLLFGADRAGLLPPREDGRVAVLEQRIAGLAARDALTALDKRVSGTETALKSLPEAVKAAEATAKQALAQAGQQGGPSAEGDRGAALALPADVVARLDSLDQRVSALQEEPGKDGQAAVQPAPELAGVPDRLKALEDKAAAPPQELDQRLAALQADVESRTTANAEAARTLGQRLDALQQALDERVKSATEAVEKATQASQQAAEAGRTQAQETTRALERAQHEQADKIAALDKAVGQRAEAATVQAALRVVAADRVATALSTGAPYAEPLTTLRKLETGGSARLDALAPFADAGAPTTAQLAAEFRPVAEKAAAARRASEARSVAESGDIKAKLLSMADSIVQVRRVDAPPASGGRPAGEDPVEKLQAALDRGALQDAVTAFEALPQEAKAEAGPFGEKLKARNAAAQAARALLSDAFKTLPAGP